LAARHRHHDGFEAATDVDSLDRWKRWRIDSLYLLCKFLECPITDLLADQAAIGFYAEDDAPAPVVEHCAGSLHGRAPLTGRTLELEHLRFANADHRFELM
jgi:hypothetical protein